MVNQSSPPILFFGNDWAAENRTSSHHIARWLAQRGRLHYVECPGLRAPKASGRDFWKIGAKINRFFQGVRRDREGVLVQTLLQIPLHRYSIVRGLNRRLILGTLRGLIRKEEIFQPISWFMIPHLASIVGRLGESISIYYCIDDYASFPDVDSQAVRAMDEEMTRKADLVFVASETLLESKRRLNPHTFLSPHGVDVRHFAWAQDPALAPPPGAPQFKRPIIGFFGLIERWIDLKLIDFLASQRPGWSFVMIGRTAVPAGELPRRPNIHFVGKQPYLALPAWGKLFDAAIIPYHLTQQVWHANPLKLREYLAMGKPVVSVSTPEIDKFSEVVEIARSPAEFLERLDKVLAVKDSPAAVLRRMDRVADQGWNARLENVWEIISNQLAANRPPVLVEA